MAPRHQLAHGLCRAILSGYAVPSHERPSLTLKCLFCQIERPEVIGNLPDIAGMDVIEMGAGIGRMTADIAPVAKSVIAVDFMQKSTDTNAQVSQQDPLHSRPF